MQHLSIQVATRKMVHSTLDESPHLGKNAFFGFLCIHRHLGSRPRRCGGLIKRAMHHLSSREAGRKILHRTPSKTPYTSRTRYPKWPFSTESLFSHSLRSEDPRSQLLDLGQSSSSSPKPEDEPQTGLPEASAQDPGPEISDPPI